MEEYSAFHKQNSGLTLEYTTIPYDFTDYPTYTDGDGDQRPTKALLEALTARVTKKYGKYGADHVKLLIHEDNWKSDPPGPGNGIWGTNWSYVYGTFHVQYCRWDKDNPANTFGTINHEDDHTYDALCATEIGINIAPILNVSNYDAQTTHGDRANGGKNAYHGYIRYQENAKKLKVLAPYLQAAYRKRQERHVEEIRGMQKTVINLLEKVVYLYRQLINKKDGVPR